MTERAHLPLEPERVAFPVEGQLPTLDGASSWLNSEPLTRAGLRGKVVLVQFWTYSCINWRRTLPYVRAWSEKYAASGLVVIGVHTPEFDFERDAANVRRFVREAEMAFPIAVDSERAVWDAFDNAYWPALYFVDAEGRVRHHHFGEGEYERSERVIQALLAEAGATGAEQPLASGSAVGPEVAADWANLRSPENYLGYERTQNLSSPGSASLGRRKLYSDRAPLRLDHWALSGEWTMRPDAVLLERAEGRILYRFHARDLHVVMGAAAPGAAVRFRVRLDGQLPGVAHGVDVDGDGIGTVSETRMYQLIRQPQPIIDRDFEIEFLGSPVAVFSFTFG